MVKRKYLIVALVLLPIKVIGNSAWLPAPGKYRHAISTSSTHKEARKLKDIRMDIFNEIEQEIKQLIMEIMVLEDPKTLYEVINGERTAPVEILDLIKEHRLDPDNVDKLDPNNARNKPLSDAFKKELKIKVDARKII